MFLDVGASSEDLDLKCLGYSSAGPRRPSRDHVVPTTPPRFVKHPDQKVSLPKGNPTVDFNGVADWRGSRW